MSTPTSSIPAPVEKNVKSADGTRLYADARGDPNLQSIVFIHGLACSSSVFDQLVAHPALLAKFYMASLPWSHLSNYLKLTIILQVRYDIRGLGWSDHPEDATAYESIRFAEDFAAVATAYNLKKPFLAGWSVYFLIVCMFFQLMCFYNAQESRWYVSAYRNS